MLITALKNKFIVLSIITFGTLSFPMQRYCRVGFGGDVRGGHLSYARANQRPELGVFEDYLRPPAAAYNVGV